MKTIYNTYVEMQIQEQCDRMKQLCLDNKLTIWEDEIAFKFHDEEDIFGCSDNKEFYILPHKNCMTNSFSVTEQEFIELLKTRNDA